RLAAVSPAAALAAQPDPLAVLHAGGDAGLDLAGRGAATGAVAGGAPLVVDQRPTATAGAVLVDRERAAHGADHEARALALGTDLGRRAWLAPGAMALGAGRGGGQPEGDPAGGPGGRG